MSTDINGRVKSIYLQSNSTGITVGHVLYISGKY